MMPRPSTVLAGAATLVVTLALQVSIFSRLPLPGNAPNLPLVVVVAVALAGGVPAGIGMGFTLGLAADLLSDHPIGLLAFVFLLVGLVVGGIEAPSERSVAWPIVIVAVTAVLSFLLYLVVYALIGRHGIAWRSQLEGLPEEIGYDVMLAPFVVPVVAAAARRLRLAVVR